MQGGGRKAAPLPTLAPGAPWSISFRAVDGLDRHHTPVRWAARLINCVFLGRPPQTDGLRCRAAGGFPKTLISSVLNNATLPVCSRGTKVRWGGACLDGDRCNLVSYCGVAPWRLLKLTVAQWTGQEVVLRRGFGG